MGSPMALSLYKKLSPITSFSVFDLDPKAAETLAKETASSKSDQKPEIKTAKSIQDIAKSSNVIITMLPASVSLLFFDKYFWNRVLN